MNGILKRITLVTLLAVLGSSMIGCNYDRLKAEKEALYRENQEYRDRLTQTQAALDASVADREREAAEAARLQAEIAAREAAAAAAARDAAARRPAPRTPASNSFTGIANVESFENNGLLTVRVQGDVLFSPGSADLKSTSKKTLSEVIAVLKREYPNNAIRIGGYTDSDPIRKSKWKNNEELSLARANSVRTYLREQGISSSRLFAAGFGSTNPRATKALSRRVEIVVVLSGQ